jgi:hypothetical protein
MNREMERVMVDQKWNTNVLLIVLLVLGGVVFIAGSPAIAQTTMTLAVLPETAELELNSGDTITVDLYMTNAVDANGFDVTLTYDPAVVQLDSWAHGGAFSNLYIFMQINEPGTFRLAAAQQAQAPVSGEGSVLKLTFSGVAVGTSDLTITAAEFADPTGEKTHPDRIPGSLAVFYPRSTVTGTISLQGQENYGGIPAVLSSGQTYGYGPYNGVTVDQIPDNLNFGQVVQDTYIFTTNQPRYLNLHSAMNIEISVTGNMALADLHLMGGNAVWSDNVIDISDASVVGTWYELSLDTFGDDEGYHPDVNFDGIVNILDLAMVAGNFDLTSEVAYDGWVP